MPQIYGPPAKTARRFLTAALLLSLLGACDAIYDDTKGWANRLEASILQAAHEIGEPPPGTTADKPAAAAAAAPMPASETPPAVPIVPVDSAALPAPDGMASEAMAQDATTPALSAPGMSGPPPAAAKAADAPDGIMAEAAGSLLAATPPKPGTPAKPGDVPQPAAAPAAPPLPKANRAALP